MPQQAAAEDTRDQCVSLPGTDSSVATITSSTWSSRLQALDASELPFPAMPAIRTRPENLPTGLLLAGAGGFLDAYTFVGRGEVFANRQRQLSRSEQPPEQGGHADVHWSPAKMPGSSARPYREEPAERISAAAISRAGPDRHIAGSLRVFPVILEHMIDKQPAG
jgi:hypothetical protein